MKLQRLCKVLAFVACGGVLLQTSGCTTSSVLTELASALIPIVVEALLSGLIT